jgi:hypothetical protein
MNVPLARSSPNTVVLNRVKLYFREYPGASRGGTDGAIADQAYVLRAGGTTVSGNTDREGAIQVDIPAGQAVTLEIFGTTFELTKLAALEANNTLRGAQRRMNIIGYRAGPVDGLVGMKTDKSLLDFQADQGLTLEGLTSSGAVPAASQSSLQSVVGP